MIVKDCNFSNNNPIIDAFFRISTNSKLFIYNTLFNATVSLSRGGIILADYKNSYVFIYNSTFINNFNVASFVQRTK